MKVVADSANEITGSICFHFSGISPSLFNLIRHAVFKDVRVLAVDTVTFHQYDGALEPEMVSHRIGQLPLRYVDTASVATTAVFSIDVIADTTKCGLTWVTSKNVVCTSGNAEVVHYRTPAEERLASGDDGFLLVPLHPGQRLKVTFAARVSTGREATRWLSTHCAPRVQPSFSLKIETTGATDPTTALKTALQCTATRLQRLADDMDR